jgi:hypothetical protein
MSLIPALLALRPGCEWTLTGEDYDSLLWLPGNSQPKPSRAELETWTPPVTPEMVDVERDRRLALGFAADLGRLTVPVDTRNETDWLNLAGLTSYAQTLVSAGDAATAISFRGADNQVYALTPPEIVELGRQGIARKSRLYGQAWALKDVWPIPADYRLDGYWA